MNLTGDRLRSPFYATVLSVPPSPDPMPDLTTLAEMIVDAAADPRTAGNIRTIHRHPHGAEMLRLIVRDDLGGAGKVVADALWDALRDA
mgnify:CR=1 FL=1